MARGWAIAIAVGALGATSVAQAAPPTPIFLWYADGGPAPAEGEPCISQTPPKYTCAFGATADECARKVQAYLDAWYADFNVVFTLRKPAAGPYYTVVVTSSAAWCSQSASVGGVAPINCEDMHGGTAYAFACGYDAKACATVIAQEQAHMVGLGHTTSRDDAMYPVVQATSDGFEDAQNDISGNQCRVTQNSYRMMLDRLGAWPGGAKPDPFAPPVAADAGAPEPTERGASVGAVAGPRTTSGSVDGGVSPGTPVTSPAPSGAPDDDRFGPTRASAPGCSFAPVAPPAAGALALLALGALVARGLRLARAAARRRSEARRPPMRRHR